MRVYLIGFMGCGKSHTGRRLAALLQWPFIELDEWIEAMTGLDIPAIFAQKGEAWFREQEQRALRRTASWPQAVVSCGGGTPCFFDNMEWMNAQGFTIYLEAPPALLLSRLWQEAADRPLLAGLDEAGLAAFVAEKLAAREAFYRQANAIYHQKETAEDVAGKLWSVFGPVVAGK